jgi:hypothetical protein
MEKGMTRTVAIVMIAIPTVTETTTVIAIAAATIGMVMGTWAALSSFVKQL